MLLLFLKANELEQSEWTEYLIKLEFFLFETI